MDMDVAWCLSCSVQTVRFYPTHAAVDADLQRDPSSPYCSEACRARDNESPKSPALSVSITSSVPPQMMDHKPVIDRRFSTSGPSPPSAPTPRAGSPIKHGRPSSRPPITPHHGHPLPATTSGQWMGDKTVRNQPRDRRAFSFPAVHAEPPTHPLNIAQKREARLSQAMMLPFVRKPMGVSLAATPSTPPIKEGPNGTLRAPGSQRLQSAFMRVSKSTGGANTPLDPDSVFCSTSGSEDEGDRSPMKLLFIPPLTTPAATTSTMPTSIPLSCRSTNSKSRGLEMSAHHTPPIARVDFARAGSQSPVAALVASSASSRSREDILSWARAVGFRPDGEREAEEERGRSRTRRDGGLKASTPSQDNAGSGDHQAGTTPKGGLTSALAGLGIGGFGPIVKALTSSISPHPPQLLSDSSSVSLQADPSLPAVAPIDVVTRVGVSSQQPNPHDSDAPPFYFGGATPTLSTVSYSEAIDPSVNGTMDHAEIVTDDALSTASYVRRPQPPKLMKPSTVKQTPLPLRPITTTATAIWNMTTYIRSFAPFSIASVIAPYAPPSATSKVASGVATPAPIAEDPTIEDAARASPVPTARAEEEVVVDTSVQDMVRSLPLDIVIPHHEDGVAAQTDRLREKQLREQLARMEGSVSRSRSGAVRSRSRSRGRAPRSRSRSDERSREGRRHIRKTSYDADASDEDGTDVDADDRRGRSRRGKVLARDVPQRRGSEAGAMPSTVRRLSEGGMRGLGDRSESRGRAPRR